MIVHNCANSQRVASKPQPPIMRQLPPDRLNSGPIFNRVGVNYAGSIMIKSGSIRKSTITKSYIAVFVSLSVRVVHLETVTSLTTTAFIATLCPFISR